MWLSFQEIQTLLDKAKLEKQIAGLESEKQAFNRSKYSAKYKLEDLRLNAWTKLNPALTV
jgi:hypothetical protein